METTLLFDGRSVRVSEYRCSAGPTDAPFVERHASACLAFVQSGSFGYRLRGKLYELVPGSLLVGREGDDYLCTHDHLAGGDVCLAYHFSPAIADEISREERIWTLGSVPPLAELMVLGELGRAAADTRISLGVDEAALRFAMRFADIAHGEKRPAVTPGARDRRRAVEAAEYLEANADQPIALDDAASRSGLSSFHFLRVFSKVIGVSPHQYLVRARLRRAARWLAIEDIPITEVAYRSGFADLSNFVRTFHRAAGVSPRSFRRVARGDRKILQDRLDRAL